MTGENSESAQWGWNITTHVWTDTYPGYFVGSEMPLRGGMVYWSIVAFVMTMSLPILHILCRGDLAKPHTTHICKLNLEQHKFGLLQLLAFLKIKALCKYVCWGNALDFPVFVFGIFYSCSGLSKGLNFKSRSHLFP